MTNQRPPIGIQMSVEQSVNEALVAHEMLRKLRFASDDIFFCVGRPPEGPVRLESFNMVQVQLHIGGQKEGKAPDLVIDVALVPAAKEVIVAQWLAMVDHWNGDVMTDAERQALYTGSRMLHYTIDLVQALVFKGLYGPGGPTKSGDGATKQG